MEYNKTLMSRLCGYLAGDGSISTWKEKNGSTHYEIQFYPDTIELAELFKKTFESLFLISPHIYPLKNYFRVRIGSKAIFYYLNSIDLFKSLTWHVPFEILNSNVNKIEFIKAFFDCEANVGSKSICVQSVNKKGLESIKFLLKELGIMTRKIYSYKRKNINWNINYLLFITGKENLKKYFCSIGFNHKLKMNKLSKLPACQSG